MASLHEEPCKDPPHPSASLRSKKPSLNTFWGIENGAKPYLCLLFQAEEITQVKKRMEISELVQEGHDIQWFAIDIEGSIASFWSGGSKLPRSVAADYDSNESLVYFFARLEEFSLSVNSNGDHPNVGYSIKLASAPNFGQSLDEIALRGLFAYDIMEPGRFFCADYSLEATPKRPLNIADLPENIALILQRTTFYKRFPDFRRINLADIQ